MLAEHGAFSLKRTNVHEKYDHASIGKGLQFRVANTNAALHNGCVSAHTHQPIARPSIALFVALTRAVRQAGVGDDVRLQAYGVLDKMARSVGRSGFEVDLDALDELAARDAQLRAAIQPFRQDLEALVPQL